MKILIIRFSSIGDIVLTTPVIRAIKKKYPSAELHYLIKNNYLPVIQHNPYIHKIFTYSGTLKWLLLELRKEKYDYLIDLQNNFLSQYISFRLNIKCFHVNKINIRKWLMVNFKINFLPDKHLVERYFDTLKILNVYPDMDGLDYFISEQEQVKHDLLPDEFRNGFATFAIGGAHFTKKLPPEKIAEFAGSLSFPVLFLGSEEDRKQADLAMEIIFQKKNKNEIKVSRNFYNGCGIFSLNQSADLIKQSNFILTHDTGMMHIAAAFKKKVITFWGNTTPEFGMYPYKTSFLAIENNSLPCRPCTKIGYKKCPVGHFKCMTELRVNSAEIDRFIRPPA